MPRSVPCSVNHLQLEISDCAFRPPALSGGVKASKRLNEVREAALLPLAQGFRCLIPLLLDVGVLPLKEAVVDHPRVA